ncbi:hypothetical protein P43SY_007750 [Pythium insidiosum]|uniref:Uncharacterized protein n=1 Tax=Pythium insidiosum TaxID=114742 RepID=A0AAD5M6K8_PYTIN|nr:hypothetical protein P43SY_007750 [Pythium insidiosum]
MASSSPPPAAAPSSPPVARKATAAKRKRKTPVSTAPRLQTKTLLASTRDELRVIQTVQEIAWSCVAEALCGVAGRARRGLSALRRLELVVIRIPTLATLVLATSAAHEAAFDAIHSEIIELEECPAHDEAQLDGSFRLIVAYAADDESTWEHLQASVAARCAAAPLGEVWVCLRHLLTVKESDSAPCIKIFRSAGVAVAPQELRDTMRPIRELLEQCGWRLALELLQPHSPESDDSKSGFLSMTSSISHMPFQVLLLILRWTRFHDRVYHALWDAQKQFYRELGIRAWSDNIIPFGVSSSSYLARQYARLAVDFLREHAPQKTRSDESTVVPPCPRTPNCVVWEAASGSCKFLHSFLIHFYDLVESEDLEARFGIVPCVVASDLSEQVLASRQAMPCFQRFLADGRLDFAHFDSASFLQGDPEKERYRLYLRCQQIDWRVGHDIGPVFFMGNYFVDSLRADAFVVSKSEASVPSFQIRPAFP